MPSTNRIECRAKAPPFLASCKARIRSGAYVQKNKESWLQPLAPSVEEGGNQIQNLSHIFDKLLTNLNQAI